MTNSRCASSPVSPGLAAAVASCAYAVPLALSLPCSPSPNHPRILAWYLSLRQPRFKPPDWVIPVAWTVIETGLAVSAYRLMRARPSSSRTRSLGLWGWNVFMIGEWSRLFFGRRQLGVSTIAAASMVASGTALVKRAGSVDRTAAAFGTPFVAWTALATVLTAAIWSLNRDR